MMKKRNTMRRIKTKYKMAMIVLFRLLFCFSDSISMLSILFFLTKVLLTFFTILSFLFALGGVFVQIGFFHCSNWRGFLVKPICKRLQKWKLQKRLAKRAVSDRTDTTFHRLTGMTHLHASSTQQKHATTHQNTATAHVWDAQFDCHGTITHQTDETTVRFSGNSNAAVQQRSKLVR